MGDDRRQEYLQRLSDELKRRQFKAEIVTQRGHLHLRVTNPAAARMTERILCEPDDRGSWSYWWPWRQPVSSVDDLDSAIQKITTVLRAVEGSQ